MKDKKNDAQEKLEAMAIYVNRPASAVACALLASLVIGLIWVGITWVALHKAGFIKPGSATVEEIDDSTEKYSQYLQSLIEATCYHQKTLSLQKNNINPGLNPTSLFVVTDFNGFAIPDRAEVWCVTEVAKATLGDDGWLVEDKESTWFILRENHKRSSDGEQRNLIMTDIAESTYLGAFEHYNETGNNLKQYVRNKVLENEQ